MSLLKQIKNPKLTIAAILSNIIVGFWLFTNDINLSQSLSFLSGKWSPWQSFIINPSQLLLFGLLIFLGFKNQQLKNPILIISLILGGYFILQNQAPTLTLVIVINILLLHLKNFLPGISRKLITGLILSQITIAFLQFLLQSDLGLRFLSEPEIATTIKGIAKLGFENGLTIIRSYGTFDHPNILAGFLCISFLASEFFNKSSRLAIVIGLILPLSRAIIILPAILIAQHRNNIQKNLKIISLILLIVLFVFSFRSFSFHTTQSNQERLSEITETTDKERPWQITPIHIGYLELWQKNPIMSIFWLISLGLFFYRIRQEKMEAKNWPLIGYLALGCFDHYLFTLPIGNFLLLLALTFEPSNSIPLSHPLGLHEQQSQ